MNGCQEKSRSRPLLARAFGSKKAAASPGAQLLTTEGDAFNRLRSNACSKQTRDPELLLASIAEYYDQLTAFESKLVTLASPRLEGFRWKDAFESGKSFLGKVGSDMETEEKTNV
ncbi:hypothetical protein ANCDUO_03441 [Ancylostoma duodenale]|uniref:BRO1 domain-containing protein n=1 Tax=Ancylostoma duodenale TaxID=51022 RepID=A0A0C2GXH7_9BILA|nr:hypothetical protein ANCDUO_03441 [Ancylostoma duodenale]